MIMVKILVNYKNTKNSFSLSQVASNEMQVLSYMSFDNYTYLTQIR